MTLGRKTGGRDFEPGKSGNPDGRPPLAPKVRKLKKLNQKEFISLVSKYMRKTFSDLETLAQDPETNALDLMVISLITNTIRAGDYNRLNFLLDRTIGKVKEKHELTGKNGGPIKTENHTILEKYEDAVRRIREGQKNPKVVGSEGPGPTA